MSRTYLERKDPSGAYVFISYSHNDKDAVERLLTALNDSGADFWYDIKLRMGQSWIEKVKEVTADKNCLGILYLISADFIFSEACLEEFDMFNELVKTHKKFDASYILLDENEPANLQDFLASATTKLLKKNEGKFNEVIARTGHFSTQFDTKKIYKLSSFEKIDGDGLVSALIKQVFAPWGCMSQENGKLDALIEDGLVTSEYRVKTACRIVESKVKGKDAEWKAFAYSGDTISAVLVSDEFYGATCLSLAGDAMEGINDNLNISGKPSAEGAVSEKHLKMDEEFIACLKPGANGRVVRFLRAAEHENNYLQLKEALTKVPLTDASDDGYFFVQDNQGKLLFADRGSEDVYRYIHVDAYASIIPVIDIDYNKYNLYIKNKNS